MSSIGSQHEILGFFPGDEDSLSMDLGSGGPGWLSRPEPEHQWGVLGCPAALLAHQLALLVQ
jgi:hypothetical protein